MRNIPMNPQPWQRIRDQVPGLDEQTAEGIWLSLESRSYIIWWPVAQVLEEYDVGIRNMLTGPNVKHFPDGSVCLDGADAILNFDDKLGHYCQSGLELRENTLYRGLACFPRRAFQILTTWEYFDRIGGEGDFVVFPTEAMDAISANELQPHDLRCRVYFWRQPKKSIVENFAKELVNWGVSVSDRGIFDEGPAAYKSGSLRRDHVREYSFNIDVSTSGQNTLNWLILSILNFGASQFPVSAICFTGFE